MCDPGPFRRWLYLAIAAIIAAAAFIFLAAALNHSFWHAYWSVAPLLAGAGTTLGAAALCGAAISSLNTYCHCLGPRCQGDCTNVRNHLFAIQTLLGIQAAAAFGLVIPALVPYLAGGGMKAIAATLVLQVPLLLSLIGWFLPRLQACGAASPVGGATGSSGVSNG